MAIVGSAHVVVRALTDKLEGDIQRALQNSANNSQQHGDAIGKAITKGINDNIDIDVSGATQNARSSAGRAGDQIGRDVGGRIERGIEDGVRTGGKKAEAESGGIGNRMGNALTRGFNRGGGPSRIFVSMALRIAALVPIIGALVGGISSLVSGLFAVGSAAAQAIPSVVALGGALSALVQGAVVGMVAFGGIGDAVKAGMDAANAAGAGTAKAAEASGQRVRQAAQAVADAERNAARAIEMAQRQVRDAKENLADVYRRVAEDETDAIEAVRDAEEDLRDAHEGVRDAQLALTQARIDAKEKLLDLQFAERGGAIAEQKALMDLEDAKYMVNATALLPPDNRTRQEALLALQEAQLNLDMIRESNEDTAEDLDKIRQTGVNGTEEVKDAQEDLRDAHEATRDAVEALSDAVRAQTDIQRENARAIRDGKEALADAQQALADAYREGPQQIQAARDALRSANVEMAAGSTESQKYAQALEKLSPAARSFVKYILSIRTELKSLRTAAQEGLFPGLEDALRTLVNGPLFPALRDTMRDTGDAIGDAARQIAQDMSSGPFVASFGRVSRNNSNIIRTFGDILGDLAVVLFQVLDAARPVTNRFVDWAKAVTGSWRATLTAKNGIRDLRDNFNDAGDTMAQLWRITKNLWEGFRDLGGIASHQGKRILDVFEDATEEFAHFTDQAKNRRYLRQFFRDTTDNFLAISSLIKEVGRSFFRLGADPAIGNLATALEPTIKKIERLFRTMLDTNGDALVEMINSIIDAFNAIAASGSFKAFLTIMTGFARVLTALLNTPGIGTFVKAMLSLGAAMYAISIIRRFPGIKQFGDGVSWMVKKNADGVTGLQRMKSAMSNLTDASKRATLIEKGRLAVTRAGLAVGAAQTKIIGAWNKVMKSKIVLSIRDKFATIAATIAEKAKNAATVIGTGVQAAFNAVMAVNPFVLIIAGIALAIGAFVLMYKKVGWFRDGVQAAIKGVTKAFEWIVDAAQWVWDTLFGHSIFPDMLKAFKSIFEAIGDVVKFWVNMVMTYVKLWIHFFQDIIAPVIRWLWASVVKPVFQKIGQGIKFAWDNVIKPIFKAWISYYKDFLFPIIRFLWNKVIKPVFGFIGDKVATTWKKVIWPALKAMWDFINKKVIPVIKFLWDKVVKPVFGWIGDKISKVWNNVVKPALQGMKGLIDKVKDGFDTARGVLSKFWNMLETAAKAPVRFVVNTIYNAGIKKALNYLPFVDLPDFTVDFARGGVLPGYTPGRDIHKFYSPTAGMALNLSGGEAIMRPEFVRAMGGPGGVEMLNKMAREGRFNGRRLLEQSHASGGIVDINGQRVTSMTLKQLLVAAKLSGATIRVIQGSYEAPSSYSGTSHTGGGVVDTVPGTFDQQRWLRKVGMAAWARNIPGAHYAGSGAHVHSVSRLDPTANGNSQVAAYYAGGDGLGGRDYGPRPNIIPNLGDLMDLSIGELGKLTGPELDVFSYIDDVIDTFKEVVSNIKDMFSMGGEWSGDFFDMLSGSVRDVGSDAVSWVNGKVPGSPVPDLFNGSKDGSGTTWDRGGLARTEGWMAKATLRPERVLSPRQTEAFEKLVDVLDRMDKGSGRGDERPIELNVQVPQDASARDVVNGIVYEMRRLQRRQRYTR